MLEINRQLSIDNGQLTIKIDAFDFAKSMVATHNYKEIIEFIKFLDKEINDSDFTEKMEKYFVTETNDERTNVDVRPTVLGEPLSLYYGDDI